MSRWIAIAALVLVGTALTETRGVAQQRLEIESSAPMEAARGRTLLSKESPT